MSRQDKVFWVMAVKAVLMWAVIVMAVGWAVALAIFAGVTALLLGGAWLIERWNTRE